MKRSLFIVFVLGFAFLLIGSILVTAVFTNSVTIPSSGVIANP